MAARKSRSKHDPKCGRKNKSQKQAGTAVLYSKSSLEIWELGENKGKNKNRLKNVFSLLFKSRSIMGCILAIPEHFQHDRKEGTSSVKVAAGNFHIRSAFLGCYSNLAREREAKPGAGTVLFITVVPSWTVQCRLRKKHSQSQHNISLQPHFFICGLLGTKHN